MADMPPLSLLVVFGSVRRERQGDRLATFMLRRIEAAGHRATLADPREIELPLLDRMYKEYAPGTAPEPMERMAALIRGADGVLVVAAEYNHGIPPALKNLLDHFLEEWFHRPAGIVSYSAGRFGGVRAAMQLRMTLAELGMPTISSLLPVPEIATSLAADGTDRTPWLTAAADRFVAELGWWAEAARRRQAEVGPPF